MSVLLTVSWIGEGRARAEESVDGSVEPVDASIETPDAGAVDAAVADDDASVPLACGGALCDTTNGAELGGSCDAAPGPRGTSGLTATAGVLVLVATRRRRHPGARSAQGGSR